MADPVLVFDIETIPDLDGGRRVLGMAGAPDDDVAQALATARRIDRGHDFQPPHLHRVVAISVALRANDGLRVWSLGEPDSPEPELVQRFFDGVDKYSPTLVSWNGSGFDLPVLHYRALRHGIVAPRYWDTGARDREFRYNNYLNRYHERHTDLMDVLSSYQARAFAPLNEIALMLGLPGKLGMDGSKVFDAWRAGQIDAIRAYCETDVLNTYLIYLRFQLMRGALDRAGHAAEVARVREFLAAAPPAHWREFAAAWPADAPAA